jgi:U3 small nucleolar RNA-associated protein 19
MKAENMSGIKRKRSSLREEKVSGKKKALKKAPSPDAKDPQATILQLEAQILESRRHYNNLATLLQLAKEHETENETAILAAVALCRVFSRLLSGGDMVKSKGMPESEVVIVQWLKERYREYQSILIEHYMRRGSPPTQSVGLTLIMRLVKEESKGQKEYNWKHGPLSRIVETILFLPEEEGLTEEFAEKYFKPFDDIRFYTFQIIT